MEAAKKPPPWPGTESIMTSLISWISVDSRGPASIYLASDSRISWERMDSWDCGRKLFSTVNSPELLGYCGDVLFPSLSLGVVQNLVDYNYLFLKNDTPEKKKEKIFHFLKQGFGEYPKKRIARNSFSIIYCTKEYNLMLSVFHVYSLNWNQSNGFSEEKLVLPKKSGLIKAWGSGKDSIKKWHDRWQRTTEKGTSRSIFCSFCDSLSSGDDKFSGGPPQLVGIYRKNNGRTIGIKYKGDLYVYGQKASEENNLEEIEWRNPAFERIDCRTKEIIVDAQRHKKPKGLSFAK